MKGHRQWITSIAWEPMHRYTTRACRYKAGVDLPPNDSTHPTHPYTATKRAIASPAPPRTTQFAYGTSHRARWSSPSQATPHRWSASSGVARVSFTRPRVTALSRCGLPTPRYAHCLDSSATVRLRSDSQSSHPQGKLVRSLMGHAHRVNHLALSTDYVCRTGPFDPASREEAPKDPEAGTAWQTEQCCRCACLPTSAWRFCSA